MSRASERSLYKSLLWCERFNQEGGASLGAEIERRGRQFASVRGDRRRHSTVYRQVRVVLNSKAARQRRIHSG